MTSAGSPRRKTVASSVNHVTSKFDSMTKEIALAMVSSGRSDKSFSYNIRRDFSEERTPSYPKHGRSGSNVVVTSNNKVNEKRESDPTKENSPYGRLRYSEATRRKSVTVAAKPDDRRRRYKDSQNLFRTAKPSDKIVDKNLNDEIKTGNSVTSDCVCKHGQEYEINGTCLKFGHSGQIDKTEMPTPTVNGETGKHKYDESNSCNNPNKKPIKVVGLKKKSGLTTSVARKSVSASSISSAKDLKLQINQQNQSPTTHLSPPLIYSDTTVFPAHEGVPGSPMCSSGSSGSRKSSMSQRSIVSLTSTTSPSSLAERILESRAMGLELTRSQYCGSVDSQDSLPPILTPRKLSEDKESGVFLLYSNSAGVTGSDPSLNRNYRRKDAEDGTSLNSLSGSKKHLPDLIPKEGENMCPIIKRKQFKVIQA